MIRDYKTKYKNTRVNHSGYSFASRSEGELFDLLKLMEKSGEIKNIQVQASVRLTKAAIVYIADFKYFNIKDGTDEWAEFKGLETDVWRIKRRLWKCYGPGRLLVYKKNGQRIFLSEVLVSEQLEQTEG